MERTEVGNCSPTKVHDDIIFIAEEERVTSYTCYGENRISRRTINSTSSQVVASVRVKA